MEALRQIKNGSQKPWTYEELKAGFSKFNEIHGRFPTAHEIDSFGYLPSSRSLQRSFGGLVNVRKQLFPNEIANYTIGAHRSSVAQKTFKNGRDFEAVFYQYLTSHFKEIAIHEHKLIRPGNVSSDFFIYLSESSGVVIDIFYADSILNFINVINIKLKRYTQVSEPTYLVVVGNDAITQLMIDNKTANRKFPLPAHITVASEDFFKKIIMPDLLRESDFVRS